MKKTVIELSAPFLSFLLITNDEQGSCSSQFTLTEHFKHHMKVQFLSVISINPTERMNEAILLYSSIADTNENALYLK